MEFKKIYAKNDHNIMMHVAPGHFATNHSHVNYCVDLTRIKSHQKAAKRAAAVLVNKYLHTPIDTIICLEETSMLGAYIADELSQPGLMAMNSGADICVLIPELNSNNQMIFRPNALKMIEGKNILLLLASVSTGKTIKRALECLTYYHGILSGICALFSASEEAAEVPIHSVFTAADLPGYQSFSTTSCDMCASGKKIDAIINSYGYEIL